MQTSDAMKRACAFLLVLSFLKVTVAQNLVPNGSFEEYAECPDDWDQLGGNVAGWAACANSPDFFNTCRDSNDFGVPFNWRGYQHASHGHGYSGIGTYQWNAPNFREFICAELTEPVQPGIPLHLSMRVALGGFGSYWLFSPQWATKGIGMLLTTQPFEWSIGSAYPNTAHLYMDTLFTDTSNWALLSTTYLPDSAYQYVTIGNFFDDSLSTPTLLDSVYGSLNGAYVFIDEVCISSADMGCDFSAGVGASSFDTWRTASPFNDRLEIVFGRTLECALEIGLYDSSGRRVDKRIIAAGTRQLDWPSYGLANGVYVLRPEFGALDLGPLRALHVSP